MKDNFKKTVIWTNTEPPKNYLWARDNRLFEYLGSWVESELSKRDFIPVDSIGLNKTKLSLKVGRTASLAAVVMPEDSTDRTLTWISSNPEIAQVSGNGRVSGKSIGTATITAAIGGKSASCEITVS